jgi:DNA-binding response OmpR family regulator
MDDKKPQIVIIDEDARSRRVLRLYAGRLVLSDGGACIVCSSAEFHGAEADLCLLIGEKDSGVSGFEPCMHLPKPVRIGAVGDALRRLIARAAVSASLKTIFVGPWVVDPVRNILRGRDGGKGVAEIRLTEKEKEILVFLHEHTGQPVLREDLLHAVWGYGSDIETHTLETHIYRLRQKIEKDPARPEILLTSEVGYILSE